MQILPVPKAMGKFFKGIASSGAWCCFDEFNRINLEAQTGASEFCVVPSVSYGQNRSVVEREMPA